jgi:hypothetical protein
MPAEVLIPLRKRTALQYLFERWSARSGRRFANTDRAAMIRFAIMQLSVHQSAT